MPLFLHLPTQRTIHATGTRAHRYRRSHRFTELTDTDTVSPIKNVMSSSPTISLPDSSSSPQSPPEPATTPPDQPSKSHESHTIAPETPSDSFDDLPLTDIDNHTVAEILRWVGTDPDRAELALEAETQGRNRVTLTSKLRRIR